MPFPANRSLLFFGISILLLGIGASVLAAPQSEPPTAQNPDKAQTASPSSKPQTSANSGQDIQVWLQDFKEHMREKWHPLLTQRERSFPGALTATLTLKIKRDGSLQTVAVANSSGQSFFDERCLKAVRTATPFSSFPKSFDQDAVTINFTFSSVQEDEEEFAKTQRKDATDAEWGQLIVNVCKDSSRVLERASQLLGDRPHPQPAQNEYLSMLLRSGREEDFGKLIDAVERKYGANRRLGLLRALWLYRERRFDEAHEILRSLGEAKSESERLNEGNSYQQLLGNLDYAEGHPKNAAYHWGRAAEQCDSPKDCNKLQALTKAAATEIGIPPNGSDLRTSPDCEREGYGYPAGGRMQALYKRLGLPLE
jgi:TonB family protein